MRLNNITIFSVIIILTFAISQAENVTRFQRRNVFLSRKKRYLQWPKGSNFVINFTCSKPLLRPEPLTWNTVYEMDIPFADPPDNRIFFNKAKAKRHVLERKNLFENLEDLTNLMGFNGRSCVNRLLCEAEIFKQIQDKSIVKDLLKVLFRSFLDEEELKDYNDECQEKIFKSCPISLLNGFVNSAVEGERSVIQNSKAF